MKLKYLLAVVALISTFALEAQNPIRNGLPEYGIRDCNIYYEAGTYYLTATQAPAPDAIRDGVWLYQSRDMKSWQRTEQLISRDDVAETSPYRDGWDSPKISKIGGRYVLTFGGRNDRVNPYAPTQIVVAVSDKIDGDYTIITPQTLVRANRFSLFEDTDGAVYSCWELDGSLYGAKMSPSLEGFASEPEMILAPREIRGDDKFMDAPYIFKVGETYHLVYTVFMGGYYAAYATSHSPLGKWRGGDDNIIFYRSEDQAPTELMGRYSDPLFFAPPCEIIGSVQLFEGKRGRWYMAYHSEDKYAEPNLCIDPATVSEGKVECTPSLP